MTRTTPSGFNRRTATKVKDGRVLRKNRNRPNGHDGYVLDRESPGRGFVHVMSKDDVRAFIDIIPDRHRYSERLERIVLAARNDGSDGQYAFYHREETGVIFLNPWTEGLWIDLSIPYFEAHLPVFEKLELPYERREEYVTCWFTHAQARAFSLLHVFMHELGHHYDHIHQKHRHSTQGEDYAERFANSRFKELLPAYVRTFGHPSREA